MKKFEPLSGPSAIRGCRAEASVRILRVVVHMASGRAAVEPNNAEIRALQVNALTGIKTTPAGATASTRAAVNRLRGRARIHCHNLAVGTLYPRNPIGIAIVVGLSHTVLMRDGANPRRRRRRTAAASGARTAVDAVAFKLARGAASGCTRAVYAALPRWAGDATGATVARIRCCVYASRARAVGQWGDTTTVTADAHGALWAHSSTRPTVVRVSRRIGTHCPAYNLTSRTIWNAGAVNTAAIDADRPARPAVQRVNLSVGARRHGCATAVHGLATYCACGTANQRPLRTAQILDIAVALHAGILALLSLVLEDVIAVSVTDLLGVFVARCIWGGIGQGDAGRQSCTDKCARQNAAEPRQGVPAREAASQRYREIVEPIVHELSPFLKTN